MKKIIRIMCISVITLGILTGCWNNDDSADKKNSGGSGDIVNPNALTPIARWDVVPNQRITKGETLNVGVVAFSKAGIDRVTFTVSGQGYSGTNPVSATAMTHNAQTNVYEYWFPLNADSFSTNGVFTIQATAYGKDGGILTLPTYSFVVNATGTLAVPKAWVSTSGNNTTG